MNETIEQREAERLADLERSEQLGRELERTLGVADVLQMPHGFTHYALVRDGFVVLILDRETPFARVAATASRLEAEICDVTTGDLDAVQGALDEECEAEPELAQVYYPEEFERANTRSIQLGELVDCELANVIPLFRSKTA